jgi:hypothetical protein
MDTSTYPSLGRLALINAQLRVNNQQVSAAVESQLDDAERLLRAATSHDWQSVLHLTEELAAQPKDRADKAVVRSARRVRDALLRDPTGVKAARSIGDLLAACRDAKLRQSRAD